MSGDDKKDIIEVNPNRVLAYDEADREEWTSEMYAAAGEEIARLKIYSQWILGKFADEVTEKWGDCADFARDIKLPPSSVREYRRVYRSFVMDSARKGIDFKPDGAVPWGVMQMAAGTQSPIETLEGLASKGAVTISEAYREIKESETGKPVPKKPQLKLSWDEETGKWKLVLAQEDLPKIDWTEVKEQLMAYLADL